jgi:hypothetical protein
MTPISKKPSSRVYPFLSTLTEIPSPSVPGPPSSVPFPFPLSPFSSNNDNKESLTPDFPLTAWCFGVNVNVDVYFDTKAKMGRLTITLDDDLHRAVKETAVRQGRSIGGIIEESLRFRGIKSMESARQLVSRVRSASKINEEEALRLALDEIRSHRKK